MNCSMDDSQENTIETTSEQKFSRDIIRFVLHERMQGLHWIPTGMFAEENTDSPFTSEFKDAVEKELDYNGHNIYLLYDIYFPDKSIVPAMHYSVCWNLKRMSVKRNFDKKYFIKFCAVLANYAGLSYLYGAEKAPAESYLLLVIYIGELKLLRKIDGQFWIMMQNWLEGREVMECGSTYQNTLEDISEDSDKMEDQPEDK